GPHPWGTSGKRIERFGFRGNGSFTCGEARVETAESDSDEPGVGGECGSRDLRRGFVVVGILCIVERFGVGAVVRRCTGSAANYGRFDRGPIFVADAVEGKDLVINLSLNSCKLTMDFCSTEAARVGMWR